MTSMDIDASTASRDRRILRLRRALMLLRTVPGFARLVNPVRRRYARTPRVVTVPDFDGDLKARLALDERMQSQIFWYGYCSRDICALLKRILGRGMVVVDAGANIGEVTLVAAKAVGPDGKVYAFEPVRQIADHLADNVRMNAFSQVSTIRSGLADREDSRQIFHSADRFHDGSIHNGLGTLYASAQRSVATEEVPLTTLDKFASDARLQRLDLIKLDVEGAELAALQGAAATLERFRPRLIIEVQEDTARAAGYEAADILRLLRGYGYTFETIGRMGKLSPVDESSLGHFQNVLCRPAAGFAAELGNDSH